MRRYVIWAGLAAALLIALLSGRNALTASADSEFVRPDSISSPAGPGSAEPNFAVAPDGKVYLSWLEAADSAYALRFASFDGRGWAPAQTVRTARDFFVNWADFPSLEVLRGGQLAVHWLQRTGTSTYAYGVRIALSTDGGRTWTSPLTPHSDTSKTEHGFVSLWREGSALGAVWLDGRRYDKQGHNPSNEMTLVTATVGADGRAATLETMLDERVCDCCQTAAALTAKGPIIAYRDRSSDEIRDISVVRRLDEPRGARRWTTPAPVHRDGWTVNYCPVNGPSIGADGNRVALAWFTAANDSPRVKLAFSTDAGATFGAPVRIDEGNPAGRVDVALLGDGGALVTWIERTRGDTAAVRMRRVQRDGRAGAPVTIATSSAARASGFPRMAVTGRHVMLAWTMPGRPSQVRVARAALSDIR